MLHSFPGGDSIPEILDHLDTKPHKLRMEGNRLFKRAIESLTEIAGEALARNKMTSRDIKLVVPHQANMRIIQGFVRNLDVPMEQVFTNVDRYGNMSSAAIPVALDEAQELGIVGPGSLVLTCAFGAGFTWSGMTIRL